jgi:membrane-associated phospholipid phosphatase
VRLNPETTKYALHDTVPVPDRTLAENISAVTTPYLTVPAFILLAGLAFVRDPLEITVYGIVAVGFTVVIPLGYAYHLTRRGKVDDIHIYDQRARLGPLALTGASSMAGFGILYLIEAPDGILRLAVLLFLMAGATLAATSLLKISGHVSSWTAGSTVVIILHGPYALPLLLGALPIGWSRLALARHRPVEVVVGFAYGVFAAAALCLAVGLW